MVTSRDVARLAGVSQSTVSYVMSGRRSISPDTRRRVEAAIDELAFQPNAGARALKSQRTKVIGLIVPFGPSVDTAGLLPFIESIANCAREEDHDVLLVTRDEGSAGLTRLAARSLCDGIVLMDIEARDARIPVAAGLAVPVILIGLPEDPAGLPCVDLDFELAGRMAVDDLAAGGHDRVALIGHPPEQVARDLNFIRRFQRGAQAAAAAHGLPYEVVDQPGRGHAGAAEAVDRALAGGEAGWHSPPPGTAGSKASGGKRTSSGPAGSKPAGGNRAGARRGDAPSGPGQRAGERLGIVVPSTEAVQSILHALAERGVQPGRDVSVIGLVTDVLAETLHPPVTNVSLEPRDVSRRAMQALFGLLDRDHPRAAAPVELVAPRLTRRNTTLPT